VVSIGQGAGNSQQATSGRKPPRLRQLLNSTSNATSLAETAYVPETS
jgi:hypothetical protein